MIRITWEKQKRKWDLFLLVEKKDYWCALLGYLFNFEGYPTLDCGPTTETLPLYRKTNRKNRHQLDIGHAMTIRS